jgi:hypothetical protein
MAALLSKTHESAPCGGASTHSINSMATTPSETSPKAQESYHERNSAIEGLKTIRASHH